MEIHVVQPGESLYRIAQHCGVPLTALLRENELPDPNRLTPGECVLLPADGRRHIVRRGETLPTIAQQEGTDVRALWRANPFLAGQERVTPGTALTVGEKDRALTVLGGVSRNADARALRRVLPYLDYLAVQSAGFDRTGRVRAFHAEIPVRLTHRYGAKAVYVLNEQDENGLYSGERAHRVLRDRAACAALVESAAQNAAAGEWDGVLLDLACLPGEDREPLSALACALGKRLRADGRALLTAVPMAETRGKDSLHDLRALGNASEKCVLKLSSPAHGKPGASADIGALSRAVRCAAREIPAEKLLCGLPSGGLQWALPRREGQQARPLSGAEAVRQAVQTGAPIRFDERSQTAHYNFWRGGSEHEVWFDDARSYRAKCALAAEFRLGGIAVMDVGRWNGALWAMLR